MSSSLLNQARKFQRNGDIPNAIETYKKIVADYPGTNEAKQAQFDLNEIGADLARYNSVSEQTKKEIEEEWNKYEKAIAVTGKIAIYDSKTGDGKVQLYDGSKRPFNFDDWVANDKVPEVGMQVKFVENIVTPSNDNITKPSRKIDTEGSVEISELVQDMNPLHGNGANTNQERAPDSGKGIIIGIVVAVIVVLLIILAVNTSKIASTSPDCEDLPNGGRTCLYPDGRRVSTY